MRSLIEAWQSRTPRLRGAEMREYKQFWADWGAKYDRYKTRNGKHFLNGILLPNGYAHSRVVCICGAEYFNAPDEETLLKAFQAHLDASEPERVDLGATIDR